MASSWLQLSFKAPPPALDAISNFLIERGSPGVVIKKEGVQAFFAEPVNALALKKDVQRFVRAIRKIYPGISERSLRWKILKEKNWNSSWRKFFTPQKVGKSFWIGPPWITPPPMTARKVIIIEPGMAFGTGTHPTTRGSLEFLERVVSWSAPESMTALDVGTGSGILAIALAKLGVREIWAVDQDPTALKVARENVRLNGVERVIKLSGSEIEKITRSFPVVVANLTAETIMHLADQLQKKTSSKGYLILSGILASKAKEVRLRFEGLTLAGEKRERSWITLLLKKGRERRTSAKIRR